ncbi:MAG: [FeFe] hydrogenase H-cluster radical SAM maturase HydG [Candidatus Omnitrophica bacterium]|nr:[FeFe] hydrogenase H-cluster radical SAM maturase HydG [Candidatus Omnitrophota bacterium]
MGTTHDFKKSSRPVRIREHEYSEYLSDGRDFIDDAKISALLSRTGIPHDAARIREIIQKALAIHSLSLEETVALIHVTDPALWEEINAAALHVKKKVYDNRIVTFAPLYTGNFCLNDCHYCGFRTSNTGITRSLLSLDEIKDEVRVLAGTIGHTRLIAVYGEHPTSNIDYIVESLGAIYGTRARTPRNTSATIRRVNVNAPPFGMEDLKKLGAAGIGTYQVFQETYHRVRYQELHPHGTSKSDFRWRLYSMHRAIRSGIEDVGIGALFGLYNWRFEILGLVAHALDLEKNFGIGPHTVSFPRLEPAHNTPLSQKSPFKVSDGDFKKIVSILRLAIPYAGMILTARENSRMRRECVHLGITQTDASSRIGVGAYSKMSSQIQEEKRQQFLLGDVRSLDEVVKELALMGYITSFCTAGYRCQRTGHCIMEMLRSGQEGKFCKLNAALTFREWLDDFASPETKSIADTLLTREIAEIKSSLPSFYQKFLEYYKRIQNGERDLYF